MAFIEGADSSSAIAVMLGLLAICLVDITIFMPPTAR
jgi:hypothetical protein